MPTFVMGDIHGAHKALRQCIERSGFDKEKDTLIQLGDVVDGFKDVFECVEELLTIPRLVAIRGNHDDWLDKFIRTAFHPVGWKYGGIATLRSYLCLCGKEDKIIRTSGGRMKTALNPEDIPEGHRKFFRRQRLYHIDEQNNCYVHGGFDRHLPFEEQMAKTYYWDRQLWRDALEDENIRMVTRFREIFVGHTPTDNSQTTHPMKAANVYNLDTGGGAAGRLTIMNVGTKQFWQSDPLNQLYP